MSQGLWADWSNQPGIWLSIALPALVYGYGLWRLWRRAGVGRGIRARQAAWFGSGILAIVVALGSPLEHLADDLLSAHMIQHLLLIMVAAPLLVLGRPATAFAWALPRGALKAAGRWWHGSHHARNGWRGLTRPAVAWTLHILTLWTWHLPGPYQAALANETVHALEHVMFLGTAFLFWQALVWLGGRQRLGYGAGVLYIFTAALAETPLGALMLFSNQPWYAVVYAGPAAAYGTTALADQQLAGAIMWVPPSLVMLGVAAGMFLAWLDALERRVQQRQTSGPLATNADRAPDPARGGEQGARSSGAVDWNARQAAGLTAPGGRDLSPVRERSTGGPY